MSNVFVSYKREDLAAVHRLVAALRGEGVDVWWDQDIPPNAPWEATIERELEAAGRVIVAWSPASVASDNVKAEARRARSQGRLLQVFVEACEPPLFFGERQGVDLKGWTGRATDPAFRTLLQAVHAGTPLPGAAGEAPPQQPQAVSPDVAPPEPSRAAREVETNNLPKRLPSLFGREAELAQIVGLLGRVDLVTITGSGGVGKTRLALEVANRMVGGYEDGAWLVELAPVTDPDLVPAAIARAMSVDLPFGRDPLHALMEHLRLRECLIVLDNCEHVIDAVAGFAETVLDASSSIKLLASSQELLGVEGEQVFRLRSLGEQDATALFAERASAADADFTVRQRDIAAVATICQRLDGIPLAIEMAAARAPSLGCDGVLQRLDDRFRLLTGGRRTALPRQRTLAATLDWSHGLLSENDAKVFRRLGVFSGGFTLEAAADVAADEGLDGFEVVDAVTSLVAKSLIAAAPGAERPRYRLLETTRAYSLEKLDAAGETLAFQRKHADWVLKFVKPCYEDYAAHVDDDTFAARYFGDNDNLERALDWSFGPNGDAELGVAIVGFSDAIWACQSLYKDYLRWLDLAGSRLGDVTQFPTRARFFVARATALMMNVPLRALEVADEAIDACRESSPVWLAVALNAKGFALYMSGRGAEAREIAEESLRIVGALPTGRVTSQSKMLAGHIRHALEGGEAAETLHREAIADLRAFGADGLANWFEAASLMIRPLAPAEAAKSWSALLARVRPGEMLSSLTLIAASNSLIWALAECGAPDDLKEALDVYRRSYKLLATQPRMQALSSIRISLVMVKQGRPREAAMLLGYSETECGRAGFNELVREPISQVRAHLLDLLTAEQIEILTAEGARLSEEEALKLPLQPPSETAR